MPTTSPGMVLLHSLDGVGGKDFVQVVLKRHANREDSFDVVEAVRALPKAQIAELCDGMSELLSAIIGDSGGQPDFEEDGTTVEILTAVAFVAAVAVEEVVATRGSSKKPIMRSAKDASIKEKLMTISTTLHDSCLLAAEAAPNLQEAVSKLCEMWWHSSLAGRERLVAQTVPYLLVRALSTTKGTEVKRCCSFREALDLFDFSDESITSVKGLLLRTAFCPAFLRVADGRRYIAHLFTLHDQMVHELMAIIRNQIPSGRKSVLESYGDILFRAWRTLSGPCLLQWEISVQELMSSAIFASNASMARSIFSVLSALHNNRRHKGFDAILLRLYEPILFRHVAAANPAVRRNALTILGDAFPLMDAEAPLDEIETNLSKQTQIISDSMMDSVPAVRAAGVGVATQVLNGCWELLPSTTCGAWIDTFINKLAFDSVSPDVRMAVLHGLTRLVDNPMAQPVLQKILPRLSSLIDDVSMKVRVALLDLLLAVRSIRAIKFYDIVSLAALVERLALDKATVSRRIVRLLLPSYFPPGASIQDSAGRCMALLQTSPEAGSMLLRMLHLEGIPTNELKALAAALCDQLLGSECGTTAKRKRGKVSDESSIHSDETHVLSEEMWERVALGIAEVYDSLSRNVSSSGDDESPSCDKILSLLQLAPNNSAKAAIVRMSATFSGTELEDVADEYKRLLGFCEGDVVAGRAEAELTESLLLALCSWGHVETIIKAVRGPLAINEGGAVKRQRASEKLLRGEDASFILGLVLANPIMRSCLRAHSGIEGLLPCLRAYAERGFSSLLSESPWSGDDIVASMLVYAKASLHASVLNEKKDAVTSSLQQMFSWCKDAMKDESVADAVAFGIVKATIAICGEGIALSVVEHTVISEALALISSGAAWLKSNKVWDSENMEEVIGHIGRLLLQIVKTTEFEEGRMMAMNIAKDDIQYLAIDKSAPEAFKPWASRLILHAPDKDQEAFKSELSPILDMTIAACG